VTWRASRLVVRRFALAALVAILACLHAAVPAFADNADLHGLRLVSIDRTTPGQLHMVAVVPPSLAHVGLTAHDFIVHQGGQALAAQVTRLANRGLQVVLVPDRAVNQADLDLELAASIELVHLLPDSIGVYTLRDAYGSALTSGRLPTMRTLGGLRPERQATAISAIAASTTAPPFSIRRAYVLMTTCAQQDSPTDDAQLKTLLSPQNQQLDVIAIGGACNRPVSSIAQGSGGSALTVDSAQGLAAAADQISTELLGEYRIVVATHAPASTPVTLEVAALQVKALASTQLSVPTEHRTSRGWLVPVAIAALLVVAATAVALGVRRSRIASFS